MENKERISGDHEDTNLVAILSVDDVKSSGLVWFPVEPFSKTGCEDSVSESSPDVNNKRALDNNNIPPVALNFRRF